MLGDDGITRTEGVATMYVYDALALYQAARSNLSERERDGQRRRTLRRLRFRRSDS